MHAARHDSADAVAAATGNSIVFEQAFLSESRAAKLWGQYIGFKGFVTIV